MSSLVDDSHAISSTSFSSNLSVPNDVWKDPNPGKEGKLRAEKQSEPRLSTPKKSAAETDKILKEREQNLKRDLIIKIDSYLNSPIFQKMGYFEDVHIKSPKDTDSLDSIQQSYDLVQSVVRLGSKRVMTMTAFETILGAGETMGKQFFQMNTDGFADFCTHPANKDFFQPELEEISIELSNTFLPDPKVRLMIKILKMWGEFKTAREMIAYQEQFKKMGMVSEEGNGGNPEGPVTKNKNKKK